MNGLALIYDRRIFLQGRQVYRAGCLFAATSYYRTERKTMLVDYGNFLFLFLFFSPSLLDRETNSFNLF
jgi:hypothetical protein